MHTLPRAQMDRLPGVAVANILLFAGGMHLSATWSRVSRASAKQLRDDSAWRVLYPPTALRPDLWCLPKPPIRRPWKAIARRNHRAVRFEQQWREEREEWDADAEDNTVARTQPKVRTLERKLRRERDEPKGQYDELREQYAAELATETHYARYSRRFGATCKWGDRGPSLLVLDTPRNQELWPLIRRHLKALGERQQVWPT